MRFIVLKPLKWFRGSIARLNPNLKVGENERDYSAPLKVRENEREYGAPLKVEGNERE